MSAFARIQFHVVRLSKWLYISYNVTHYGGGIPWYYLRGSEIIDELSAGTPSTQEIINHYGKKERAEFSSLVTTIIIPEC